MSDINHQLVREYFELNEFRTFTHWPQSPDQGADHASQIFAERTGDAIGLEVDFVLQPRSIAALERASIEIRAWHTDRFYPSVIEANPILWQFASEQGRAAASAHFGTPEFSTILVVSELPNASEPRLRAQELLQESGIDHVLEFPAILRDLIERVDPQRQYEGSPTLQMLRLLKRYKLTRHQQLEFPFGAKS